MTFSVNNRKFAFLCSVLLHVMILVVLLFDIPVFIENIPEEQIINFETLPVSTISNVKNKSVQHETLTVNQEAKKVPANVKVIETKTLDKTPNAEQVKKVPIDIKQLEPKKTLQPKTQQVKETESVKTVKPSKAETTPTQKTTKNKTQQASSLDNDLDSLLKTLEKSSSGSGTKATRTKTQSDNNDTIKSKGNWQEDLPLSISEKQLIKQQVEQHWNIPIGAEHVYQVKIIVHIVLNVDGSVQQVDAKQKLCGTTSSDFCQMIADSAIRAVWQASPFYGLPPERHKVWQEFNFLFDPNEISQ